MAIATFGMLLLMFACLAAVTVESLLLDRFTKGNSELGPVVFRGKASVALKAGARRQTRRGSVPLKLKRISAAEWRFARAPTLRERLQLRNADTLPLPILLKGAVYWDQGCSRVTIRLGLSWVFLHVYGPVFALFVAAQFGLLALLLTLVFVGLAIGPYWMGIKGVVSVALSELADGTYDEV